MPPLAEVRAAGGVVVRQRAGPTQVLLVHRPGYGDWSLPKGKAEPGEELPDTARREVEEETGYRCTLGDQVGQVSYVDHRGRAKVVTYWLMQVAGGHFVANDEVDQILWLDAPLAAEQLTYVHDRDIVQQALSILTGAVRTEKMSANPSDGSIGDRGSGRFG